MHGVQDEEDSGAGREVVLRFKYVIPRSYSERTQSKSNLQDLDLEHSQHSSSGYECAPFKKITVANEGIPLRSPSAKFLG